MDAVEDIQSANHLGKERQDLEAIELGQGHLRIVEDEQDGTEIDCDRETSFLSMRGREVIEVKKAFGLEQGLLVSNSL